MPVILYVPVNPTDIYMQGEQLRAVALLSHVNEGTGQYLGVVNYRNPGDSYPLVASDGQVLGMQDGAWSQSTDTYLHAGLLNGHMRNNSVIAAQTGALIPIPFRRVMMGSIGSEVAASTGLFVITGVTKNSSGSPLGDCRVVALETGRIQIDGTPVVGETISDGSGNYSITVPGNMAFQLIAYKPGSPDVAGITRSDVVPTMV